MELELGCRRRDHDKAIVIAGSFSPRGAGPANEMNGLGRRGAVPRCAICPYYSADLKPIEMAFSKFKASLSKGGGTHNSSPANRQISRASLPPAMP